MIEEFLENGHKIRRFIFKEGYIDFCYSYKNPIKKIGGQHVGRHNEYFRLNGQEWFNKYDFKNGFNAYSFREFQEVYSAEEYWNEFIRKL